MSVKAISRDGEIDAAAGWLLGLDLDGSTEIYGMDGIKYSRLYEADSVEELVAEKFLNPPVSKCFIDIYRDGLKAALESQGLIGEFKDWLTGNLYILNSHKEEVQRSLDAANELKNVAKDVQSFLIRYHQFSKELFAGEFQRAKLSSGRARVLVVGTTGAGGEQILTAALVSHLQSYFEVFQLDTKMAQSCEDDPVYKLTCRVLVSHKIWQIYQQIQADPQKCSALYRQVAKLNRFISNDIGYCFMRKAQECSPEIVFSMRYADPKQLEFIDFLPFIRRLIIAQCDHKKISDMLSPLLPIFNSKVVQVALPLPPPAGTPFYEKINSHVQEGRIVFWGAPVRSEIQVAKNLDEISFYREELNIPEGARVLFMMMGMDGMGNTLDPLIEQLRHKKKELELPPLHLIIVCGRNELMQRQLEKLVAPDEFDQLEITFTITGRVEAKEISKFYNVADIYVGKPGGSTTAELLLFNHLFVLLPPSYNLEDGNREFLVEELKKGETIESFADFPALVFKWLNASRREFPEYIKRPWQQYVDQIFSAL